MSVEALERWGDVALATTGRERALSAAARFDVGLTTAAMCEARRHALCFEDDLYPQELAAWRHSETQALADSEEQRASPKKTASDSRRIKQLERDLDRKDKPHAETAALLVPAK